MYDYDRNLYMCKNASIFHESSGGSREVFGPCCRRKSGTSTRVHNRRVTRDGTDDFRTFVDRQHDLMTAFCEIEKGKKGIL